jgi:hypothetical protein
MLLDAHKDGFDQAIIVSNDSDLLTPIRFVRREFKKRVGILNPHRNPSQVLIREADFIRPIRTGPLSVSQFPEQLRDSKGLFERPRRWR